MIPLGLGSLVFVYAGGLLALVLLIWAAREFFRARAEASSRRALIRCALCGTLYEGPPGATLPPCPQCERPNERATPPSV